MLLFILNTTKKSTHMEVEIIFTAQKPGSKEFEIIPFSRILTASTDTVNNSLRIGDEAYALDSVKATAIISVEEIQKTAKGK